MLAIQNDREWARFASEVLGNSDMVTDERFDRAAQRYAHRVELEDIINAAFAKLSGEQCDGLLEGAKIAHSRQRDVSEIADHPQLLERERWDEVDSPVGPLSVLKPPVITSDFEYRTDAIPAVGEHTESILSSLGFDRAEVDALRAEGAI